MPDGPLFLERGGERRKPSSAILINQMASSVFEANLKPAIINLRPGSFFKASSGPLWTFQYLFTEKANGADGPLDLPEKFINPETSNPKDPSWPTYVQGQPCSLMLKAKLIFTTSTGCLLQKSRVLLQSLKLKLRLDFFSFYGRKQFRPECFLIRQWNSKEREKSYSVLLLGIPRIQVQMYC